MDVSGDIQETGGYARDVVFEGGIKAAQMPYDMALAAAAGGHGPPDLSQPFVYVDFGCGVGVAANAVAALYPHAAVVGVDFNAEHIWRARDRAAEAGLTNVRFINRAFSEIEPGELPAADLCASIGTYAWLPEREAAAVRQLLDRVLRPGGLFVVEYMSAAGKAAVAPYWRLIQTLVPARADDTSYTHARRATGLNDALVDKGLGYFGAHKPPQNAARRYRTTGNPDQHARTIRHFAHNALAAGFRPRFFPDMAEEMAAAGLRFAGRTELALNELDLSVPAGYLETFATYAPDPVGAETLKDFVRNEHQRHDVFIRAEAPDPGAATRWLLDNLHLLARNTRDSLSRTISVVGGGKVELDDPIYNAYFALADDHPVGPLEVANAANVTYEHACAAAVRLAGTRQFFLDPVPRALSDIPALDGARSVRIQGALNRANLAASAASLSGLLLLSPATGRAEVPVGPLEAMLLRVVVRCGRFDEAPAAARDNLSRHTAQVQAPSGSKPAFAVPEADLQTVLNRMAGRKLLNMVRLGIVEPVVRND